LKLLKQTTSFPLSGFLIQTPQHKLPIAADLEPPEDLDGVRPRKSPRLKKLNKEGNSVTKMAQDLIVKKCGIIEEEETLDSMTLQQYLQLYKKPLSENSMDAIHKLTEVAVNKNKKKLDPEEGKAASKGGRKGKR
jgi:hypothetical protein